MASTISNDVLNNINGTASSGSGSGPAKTDSQAAQDRFLTLLVAQLNNQDPMNPMDNAEMTSQIAQINTVTGIEKLNTTISSIAAQVASMQALQSSALIGRDVLVPGKSLAVTDGVGSGSFDLAGKADAVKVEIVTPGGKTVGTVNLGALDAGRQTFDWTSGVDPAGLSVKITASSGTDSVTATALQRAKIISIGSGDTGMTLQLQGHADVAYADVKAVL